ncbi:MAG: DUF4465 domain-containing protein [Bacteroidales bacterium]|nr:DUF4465 domain-containing protein [Bacteroidales bacterium]
MLRKHIYVFLGVCIALMSCEKEETMKAINVNFEDLQVPAIGYWNGSDNSGGFTSGGLTFNNIFTDWGGGMTSWFGFAYSTKGDVTTAGYGNQYSSYAGSGFNGSANFLVAGVDFYNGTCPTITYADTVKGFDPYVLWVTNSAYPAISMRDGDLFAKKFGGETGQDPDWFKLMIIGIGLDGLPKDTIDFYLADYRGESGDDYIIKDWTQVDIGRLGRVKALKFDLSSSDVGLYGMNTPAYFCIDQISYLIDND